MSHSPVQPPPPGWGVPTSTAPPVPPSEPTHGVWATPAASSMPAAAPGTSPPPHAVPPRTGGSLPVWLAAGALVVSLIALVIALAALFHPLGSSGDSSGSSSFGGGTGSGTVPGAVVGQTLSGDRIAYSVVDALLTDGAEVDPGGVQCDTLLRLDAGSSSDCHGTVDGDDTWSGWVQFEGTKGDFTLYED